MKTNPNDSIHGHHAKLIETAGELELIGAGFTKREHFAGLAMQGFISDNEMIKQVDYMVKKTGIKADKILATMAVTQADALITALNEDKDED